MSATELTLQEVSDSVTGYDEIAVEKHMGVALVDAAKKSWLHFLRCIVFVHQRHLGVDDAQAKHAALSLTHTNLKDYFAAEPDEIFPDEPETPAGKESSPPLDAPTGSPSSASTPE